MKLRRHSYSVDLSPGIEGVEFAADGKTPTAFRLWRFGENPTDKDGDGGAVRFTVRSAKLVSAAFKQRGMPLRIDYEHNSLIPSAERKSDDIGVGAGKGLLEMRGPKSAPEPWIAGIEWTERALGQIHAKERSEISPYIELDKETREVTKILNVALCFEGATHKGVLLAAAREKGTDMQEMILKILAAVVAGDYALVASLGEEAAAMEDGGEVADMAKALVKNAAPPPPKEEPVAASTLAGGRAPRQSLALRDDPGLLGQADRLALKRATDEAQAATRGAKRATVEMMIATNRAAFDAVDEREHIALADPDATRRHIGSFGRKVETTTLAASRETTTEAKPPKGATGGDATHGLSEIEIKAAARDNVSLKDFASSKARLAANVAARKGG